MAVFHQRVQPEAEPGFFPTAFAGELCLRIGRALVRGVAALLPVEVHAGVAGVAVLRVFRPGPGLEALQARPGVDQRAVHREVRVAGPAVLAGQSHHVGEEQLSRLVGQQPVLVLGEGAVVPHRVEQVEVEGPAEEQVVV